jgi:hypothetical protein
LWCCSTKRPGTRTSSATTQEPPGPPSILHVSCVMCPVARAAGGGPGSPTWSQGRLVRVAGEPDRRRRQLLSRLPLSPPAPRRICALDTTTAQRITDKPNGKRPLGTAAVHLKKKPHYFLGGAWGRTEPENNTSVKHWVGHTERVEALQACRMKLSRGVGPACLSGR